MFLHGAFPASQRRLRNFGSGWFRVKKMTTKNGQEGFFTGKACKKIYGNRRFKLTIHLNISHDDYCIVDGTLCVAALQRPLGSFVYGAHFRGKTTIRRFFPKKVLKFLMPGIWHTGPTHRSHTADPK